MWYFNILLLLKKILFDEYFSDTTYNKQLIN